MPCATSHRCSSVLRVLQHACVNFLPTSCLKAYKPVMSLLFSLTACSNVLFDQINLMLHLVLGQHRIVPVT